MNAEHLISIKYPNNEHKRTALLSKIGSSLTEEEQLFIKTRKTAIIKRQTLNKIRTTLKDVKSGQWLRD